MCWSDIHKEDYVGCIMDSKENIVRELSFPSTKEGAQSYFFCIVIGQVT